ncbi:MAG: SUMF1/EgtB/PvdO family nonheme iron enzyme [Chloroflexi bacterium]|nr:SUMF1/EgtB/PvdO family nonheme iron enzyme [Chloroflexota bacterium]
MLMKKPAHTVEIAPFEMAVFPVTNAEFGLFMAAGGYEDEQWWQAEAAKAWWRGDGSSEGRKQAVRDVRQQLQDWTEEGLQGLQASPDMIDYWIWLKNVDVDELEQKLEKAMPTGEVYRQPEYWEDGRFNHPTQPVVGITWF